MTSTELAKLCYISRATVDRVFNNRGNVNEKTREYILRVAKSVNYRPNYFAKSLVTGKSMTIGLLLPSMVNTFFYDLFQAVSNTAQQSNYAVLASFYEDKPGQEEEGLGRLLDRHIDGILLFSTEKDSTCAETLRQRNTPAIALMNRLSNIPCVSTDYYRAMKDAVNYVLSKGYRRLLFICPPLEYADSRNMDALVKRYQGYLDAVRQHNSDSSESVEPEVIDTSDYLSRIQSISLGAEKTAFLCSSDIYALRIIKSLKMRGISVPAQAGVMGFDGINILSYLEPTLATVKIMIDRLGIASVQQLVRLIDSGVPPEDLTVPYSIEPGQSIV